MRLLLLAFVPLTCLADPHAQEIQRALMQLDQRTVEFARGVAPQPAFSSLPAEAGRALHHDAVIARELRPYERFKAMEAASEGYVLRLPPPRVRAEEKPLPLPGGPRHVVEPIPATGVGS